MLKGTFFNLPDEEKEHILWGMKVCLPLHIIAASSYYFTSSDQEISRSFLNLFFALALTNSLLHASLSFFYKRTVFSLGQLNWNRTYTLTLFIHAITYCVCPIYIVYHLGSWHPLSLYSLCLWIFAYEGFAKFCFALLKPMFICMAILMLPIFASFFFFPPKALFISCALVAYGILDAFNSYKRHLESKLLHKTRKEAFEGSLRLQEFLELHSSYLFEFDQELHITDTSSPHPNLGEQWVIPPELKQLIESFLKKNLEERKFSMMLDLLGERRWYHISLKSEEERIIAILVDIHELKVAEKEIEDQKFHQLQTNKLISLGEMAGGIAHEINNPLNILVGNIFRMKRQLKAEPDNTQPIMQGLEHMEDTIKRIAQVLKGLKNITYGNDQQKVKNIRIGHVIEDSISLFSESIKNQGIQINMPQNVSYRAMANYSSLGQSILSLVHNSIEALAELEEDQMKVPKQITFAFKETPNSLILQVKDNGPGPSSPDKMFDPFYSTKDVGEGKGLGLTTAKALIENMGGKLRFKRINEETIFEIELPLEKPQEEAQKRKPA